MTAESVSTISRRSFLGVGVATGFSAVVGFVVLLIVPRLLSPADTSLFLAFWAFLFAWFGIFGGLSAESTRAVHTSDRMPDDSSRPRLLPVGLVVGIVVGVLLWATSLWWGEIVLDSEHAYLAIPLSCSVALFAGHSVIAGVLQGRLQWSTFARLVIADSTIRLVLVVLATLVAAVLGGFAVAASVSSVTWLIGLAFSPTLRSAARARSDDSLARLLSRFGHACVASGSSAILVVGFPVVLRLTSSDAAYLAAAPLLVAITFTRAPLMIPLNAYQGVAIAHFLHHRSAGFRALAPIAGLIAAVSVVGAVIAFFAGPPLLTWWYGSDYHLDSWVVGTLVVAAGLLALISITGALCLALDKHNAYSLGWITAVVVAVLVLLVPLETDARVVLALAIGPVAGLVVHLLAIRRAARTAAPDHIGEGTA
jgi:O-antigen/teichoic acid export membrane protein